MSEIRFAGVPCRVMRATCELYHLYFDQPDWSLEVETDGIVPRLAVSGRLAAPALPGPSALGISYVDAPRVVSLDGIRGSIRPSDESGALRLVDLGDGRVRIDGTLHLAWRALAAGDDGETPPRDYAIDVALEAALVT